MNVTSPWLVAAPVVTWVLVIIGWLVVNHQNNKREHRKEMRALIDDVVKIIVDLEQSAVAYHCAPARDDERAITIKSSFRRLGAKLTTAVSRGLESKKPQRYLKEFRQAVTAENFDSASFALQERQSPLLLAVGQQRDLLEQALEDAFTEKFYS